MDKILVTGGAGYIGSHITKKLMEQNRKVIVLDNFSTGYLQPLKILKNKFSDLEYIKVDLLDKEKLNTVFNQHKIGAVIHLAAKIYVTESMAKPEEYHQTNYLGSLNLIEAMAKADVRKLIFSSTAAVYGNPKYTPIDERHPANPLNPYAQTKLDFEKYLERCKDLKFIIFRYFNVGGSSSDGLMGKSHLQSEDLIENIMKVALGQKDALEIFGEDFNTPDGTAIRDFIDVEDVAEAHIIALDNLEKYSAEVFNLGSESGFSVRNVIEQASKIIGKNLPIHMAKRRPGEATVSVASTKKAKELLGWNPQKSNLETIISTDWHWRKAHPLGYTNNNE